MIDDKYKHCPYLYMQGCHLLPMTLSNMSKGAVYQELRVIASTKDCINIALHHSMHSGLCIRKREVLKHPAHT